MVAPFVSSATADKIEALRARAFVTRKRLAMPKVYLLLFRVQSDGTTVQVGPREVVLTFPNRLPQQRRSPAEATTVTTGTVEAEWPFDIAAGDRCLVDGVAFMVRTVEPMSHGTVKALIELEGGAP